MSEVSVRDRAVGIRDNVRIETYDISTLRAIEPRFDDLSKEGRRRLLSYIRPQSAQTAHNVTCNPLHELVAELLNFNANRENVDDIATLAFGSDDSSFSSTDTELNNKVGEIDVVDPSNDGTEFRVDEYVDSLELNGETLRELGLVSESGQLLNHAPFPSAIDKTSSIALLVSVSIPISDASE